MCLILAAKPGHIIKSEWLIENWKADSGGAGFAFLHNNNLIVRKPFYDIDKLLKAYSADYARYGENSGFLLHFRTATDGFDKTSINTQPYIFAKGRACMVHSGVFHQFVKADSKYSASYNFYSEKVKSLSLEDIRNQEEIGKLDKIVMGNNQVVIMDAQGLIIIINPRQGTWLEDNNIWASNDKYKPSILPPCDSYSSGSCDIVSSNAYVPVSERLPTPAIIDKINRLRETRKRLTMSGRYAEALILEEKLSLLTMGSNINCTD